MSESPKARKEKPKSWLNKIRNVAVAAVLTIPVLDPATMVSQDVSDRAMLLLREDEAEKSKLIDILEINAKAKGEAEKGQKLKQLIQKISHRHKQTVKKQIEEEGAISSETLNEIANDLRNQGEFSEENYDKDKAEILDFSELGKYNCNSFTIAFALVLEEVCSDIPNFKLKGDEINFPLTRLNGIPHQKLAFKQRGGYYIIDQPGVEKIDIFLDEKNHVVVTMADLKKSLAGYDVTLQSKHIPNTSNDHKSSNTHLKLSGGIPDEPLRPTHVINDTNSLRDYLESQLIWERDKLGKPLRLEGFNGANIDLRKVAPRSAEMAQVIVDFMKKYGYKTERIFILGDINEWDEKAVSMLFNELKIPFTLQLETSTGQLPKYFLDLISKKPDKAYLYRNIKIYCKGKRLELDTYKMLGTLYAKNLENEVFINYTSLLPDEIEGIKENLGKFQIEIDGSGLTPDVIKSIPSSGHTPVIIPPERFLALMYDEDIAKSLAEKDFSITSYGIVNEKIFMKIAYLMAKYNPNHELVNAVKRVLDAPNPEPNYATERANNLQKTASELGIKVEELEHQINRN